MSLKQQSRKQIRRAKSNAERIFGNYDWAEFAIVTDEGNYSATLPRAAKKIASIMLRSAIRAGIQLLISDGTSGIGCDSIALARAGFAVESYDSNPAHTDATRHNAHLAGFGGKIAVDKPQDFTHIAATVCTPIVYLDPPWGGTKYKTFKNIVLFMNGMPLIELIGVLAENRLTKRLFVKAPRNLDQAEIPPCQAHDIFGQFYLLEFEFVAKTEPRVPQARPGYQSTVPFIVSNPMADAEIFVPLRDDSIDVEKSFAQNTLIRQTGSLVAPIPSRLRRGSYVSFQGSMNTSINDPPSDPPRIFGNVGPTNGPIIDHEESIRQGTVVIYPQSDITDYSSVHTHRSATAFSLGSAGCPSESMRSSCSSASAISMGNTTGFSSVTAPPSLSGLFVPSPVPYRPPQPIQTRFIPPNNARNAAPSVCSLMSTSSDHLGSSTSEWCSVVSSADSMPRPALRPVPLRRRKKTARARRPRDALGKLMLHVNSDAMEKFAVSKGFKPHVHPASSNPHQAAATLRSIVCYLMLSKAGRGASILAPYDHGRLFTHAQHYNTFLSKPIVVYNHGDIITSKDIARQAKCPMMLQWNSEKVTMFMMNDTYMGPHGGALTPQDLADYCELTTLKRGFIAVHPYMGLAGVNMMGTWRRDDEGLIHVVYDDSVSYVHPTVNWLFTETCVKVEQGWLIITEVEDFMVKGFSGLKSILGLLLSPAPVDSTTREFPERGVMVDYAKSIKGQWFKTRKRTPVFVHPYYQLLPRAQLRSETVFVRNSTLAAIAANISTIDDEGNYAMLQRTFPEQYAGWVTSTCNALIFMSKENAAVLLAENLGHHSQAINRIHDLNGRRTFSPWQAAMHNGCGAVSDYLGRFGKHIRRNLTLHPATPSIPYNCAAWVRFQHSFNSFEYGEARTTYGFSQGYVDCMLTDYPPHETYGQDKPNDPQVQVTARFLGQAVGTLAMPDARTSCRMTAFLSTNAIFPAPAAGVLTAWIALTVRNAKKTPDSDPLLWREMTKSFINQLDVTNLLPFEPLTIEVWLKSIRDPGKRKIMTDEVRNMMVGASASFQYEVEACLFHKEKRLRNELTRSLNRERNGTHPKTNETLYPKHKDNHYGMKPRAIITYSNRVQVMSQPFIKSGSKRFVEALRESLFRTSNGFILHFTYATGLNATGLSIWLALSHQRAALGISSFIFMGDDSAGVVIRGGVVYYVETDYTAFDQSQKDPQVEAETKVMIHLGIPSVVAESLKSLSKLRVTYKRRETPTITYSTKFHKRITGSPTTSLANTINNMIAIYAWAEGNFLESAWEAIGFRAKVQWHDHATAMTFLRGVWWKLEYPVRATSPYGERVELDYGWSWMPSAVLKMGKILRPITRKETMENIAYGMAMNIASDPIEVPVLGAFRRALIRTGRKKTMYVQTEAYRPISDSLPIDKQAAMGFMFDRYGLTVQDVAEMEQLFDRVSVLPAFAGHLGFATMADVDYG